MFIHNIQVFNNQNKYTYNSQPKKISFEANKLRLTKEVALNVEQLEQISFIADVYKQVTAFYSRLNGAYSYKFKDCFPNMLAGEKRKGFIFEGLLPKADRRLQIAKLDPSNSDEILSLRITDKEYKDLLTCRINKDGKAHISADEEYTPTWKSNPFAPNTELNYDDFLSKLELSFLNLKTYSENFINISRQLKSNMNKKTVSEAISHIQSVKISRGLKSEMDSLISNYAELDSLLKTGRSTNAVMYKRMYFGEDYDCAKGMLFRNIGKNGESYLYCPAKSKDDDRILRIVVQDKKGKIINGFVFFADGRVMKQVSVVGIKADDFRIQNLSSLSDSDIKTLGLRETMSIIDENITKFKAFVAEKVQVRSDKKARRQAELSQKAERKKQRMGRIAEKEKAIVERKEARRVKQEEALQIRQQKEEARKIKEEENAKIRQQKLEISLLKEAEKIVLEEEKEILEQRKLQAQLRDIARQARSVQEKLLGALNGKKPTPTERMSERRIRDRHSKKELTPKESGVKKTEKRPVEAKEKPQVTHSNLRLSPAVRNVATKTYNFYQFNISKFVDNLGELFATPVEERSPHLIHEYLPDGRVFKGRITVKTSDGAQVTVSKIKSPLYMDFSYYSVKITKDGQTYVLNFDKEAGKVLNSTPEGKLIIDEKHRVNYLGKSQVVQNCPIANQLPMYLDELFVRRDDAERVVLSTGLKMTKLPSSKEKMLAQKEQEILEALKLEPDYN
ncbi:hypothetical protein J6A64_01895 [bacterium]|nr:hypothetical protein [bacterium]